MLISTLLALLYVLRRAHPQTRRTIAAVLGIVVGLTAVGVSCARRGPLRAPEEIRPAPISDLRAQRRNQEVELIWSRPARTEAGGAVDEIDAFVVQRQCRGLEETDFFPLVTVQTLERGRFRRAKTYRYRHEIRSDMLPCRYRVVSQTDDGYVSQPSNVVEVVE